MRRIPCVCGEEVPWDKESIRAHTLEFHQEHDSLDHLIFGTCETCGLAQSFEELFGEPLEKKGQ